MVSSKPTLSADIAASLSGSSFTVVGDTRLRSLTFAFQSEPRNIGERLAREVLTGIDKLDAGFRLWLRGAGVNATFTTDLDNQFTDGVKRALGAELILLQNQLRKGV